MTILERFGLDGQVAVVTGSGRGIGEGLALGLADAGADIVLAARRTEEIDAVAAKVRDLGRRALAVTTDVMEIEQVQGRSWSGRRRIFVRNFIGLGVWVNVASPARCAAARNMPTAIPTDSFT